jgi:dTMP kinase
MHLEGDRRRGFFLTLEGPEGSGKSTQAQRLAARLAAAGYVCTVTREPGGTPLGEEIRRILLHGLSPVPAADALLFSAARAQLVSEVIAPALGRGEIVICDRFSDSTLAYQGYGAGLPLDDLRRLVDYAVGEFSPEMTVLIDLPVEVGLSRKLGDPDVTRFELGADLAFHRRVRDGFLAMAAAEPERFVVLNGLQSADSIESAIAGAIIGRIRMRAVLQKGNMEQGTPGSISAASEPERVSLRMDK